MEIKRIVFALGSNIGDRKFFLQKAIEKLVNSLNLSDLKQSKILENKALLLADSPDEWNIDFYNMVISADINTQYFTALEILNITKNIEIDLGRVERGRWAPREIDIDILAIDNLFIDLGNKLTIPHKELFNRNFFKKPFFEIEPDLYKLIKNYIAN